MEAKSVRKDDNVRSVVMTLTVLEVIAKRSEPMGITELAREVGTTKTTIHRHVRTLLNRGYIRQHAESGKYEAGIRLFLLGQSMSDRFDLVSIARPIMATLRDRSGQAVTLSGVTPNGILVLELLRARSAIEIGTKPGSEFGFNSTAQGKLALAYGGAEFRERVFSSVLKAWTQHTITDRGALLREIERVGRQGWATAADETYLGVNALAAPVFDARNVMQGCVALVGSVHYIPARPDQRLIDMILSAGDEISRGLGFSGEYPLGMDDAGGVDWCFASEKGA